ncbi:MAG: hypothetical protein IJO55_11575 [Lachnospiraceae bacterium]|nr:hypothetical protein [Lachnospiraceae bacterium]
MFHRKSSVMLVLGMIIVIDALLESGVGGKIGRLLAHLVGDHERSFVLIIFLSAAFFSGFMTNAPLVANNVLATYGVETMSFFTPMPIAFSILIVVAVCYRLFLYKWQNKCFDFGYDKVY